VSPTIRHVLLQHPRYPTPAGSAGPVSTRSHKRGPISPAHPAAAGFGQRAAHAHRQTSARGKPVTVYCGIRQWRSHAAPARRLAANPPNASPRRSSSAGSNRIAGRARKLFPAQFVTGVSNARPAAGQNNHCAGGGGCLEQVFNPSPKIHPSFRCLHVKHLRQFSSGKPRGPAAQVRTCPTHLDYLVPGQGPMVQGRPDLQQNATGAFQLSNGPDPRRARQKRGTQGAKGQGRTMTTCSRQPPAPASARQVKSCPLAFCTSAARFSAKGLYNRPWYGAVP